MVDWFQIRVWLLFIGFNNNFVKGRVIAWGTLWVEFFPVQIVPTRKYVRFRTKSAWKCQFQRHLQLHRIYKQVQQLFQHHGQSRSCGGKHEGVTDCDSFISLLTRPDPLFKVKELQIYTIAISSGIDSISSFEKIFHTLCVNSCPSFMSIARSAADCKVAHYINAMWLWNYKFHNEMNLLFEYATSIN